jgi:hypothetical protein
LALKGKVRLILPLGEAVARTAQRITRMAEANETQRRCEGYVRADEDGRIGPAKP